MASTSASSRPSDPKRKKNLKQPEFEREVKDCDFSYFSDIESKSDTSESFVYCDDSGWQKVGVRDVGVRMTWHIIYKAVQSCLLGCTCYLYSSVTSCFFF
jgi:hypothetical protein